MGVVFNHIGHCVADLARSKRFYQEVLDFQPLREITPDDALSAKLLRLEPPIGMTASYLARDGLVLELLHFGVDGVAQPYRERVMNEPGLTHLSVSVDDIPATCQQVREHGGEVLDDSDIGFGTFVRDPDGQLIELLPMAYHDSLQ